MATATIERSFITMRKVRDCSGKVTESCRLKSRCGILSTYQNPRAKTNRLLWSYTEVPEKRSTCAQKFQKPGRVNPKCGPRTLDKQEPVICQTHTEAHCVSHPVLVALEKVSPVEEWHDIQSALRFILLFCDHSFEEVGRHG
jgi:hypothetical protein